MKPILGDPHPDQIVYFSPGSSTSNIGDEIIADSSKRALAGLFPNSFPITISTHQKMGWRFRRFIYDSQYYFVLGSNLLKNSMLLKGRQWNISLADRLQVSNVIMVGCGWHAYEGRTGLYTRTLYRSILSRDILHSVRDEYTKKKLSDIGIRNVLNTGCATMWGLTEDFCKTIPTSRADHVVVTLTDYHQDPQHDEQMLATLLRRYEKVALWLQGSGDRRYAFSLPSFARCTIIPPTLEAFDAALEDENVDYVGTRLHGGIRALQHGRRTLIVAIDNRAREKHRDFNIPTLERDDMDLLDSWILGSHPTEIRIPVGEIERFLSQFRS